MSTKPWAIVTGSSQGLGLAMTEKLLSLGYMVAGGSRSGTDLEHEDFYDFELDVTDQESVNEFYQTLKELTKSVHVFVSNAGICELEVFHKTSPEQFVDHFMTNTLGPFLMLRGLEPFLVKGETHLVSLLSTGAKHAYAGSSSYNASKFALKGFMEVLQKDWLSYQIKFTNLYPGAIDTPLWKDTPKEIRRGRILSIHDFLYVFEMVIKAPHHLNFNELMFSHWENQLP